MVANQGEITQLAASPSSGIVDGVDTVHSGIVKALQSFDKGDICIGHAGFTITDGGTYTQYNLAQPIHFTANNKYTTHTSTLTVAYAAEVQHASYTRYDWVLLNPASPALVILQGAEAATPTVADITAGYIPIALVKITSSGTSDDDKTDYSFQLFTLDKQDNSLSIGYDGGSYYVEGMSVTNAAGDTTIENKVSDKDVIFKVNDGGSSTEVMRLDGDVSSLKMASGKSIQLGGAACAVSGDGTDITINGGGDLTGTLAGDLSAILAGGDATITAVAASKPTLTLKCMFPHATNPTGSPQLIFHSERNTGSVVDARDGDDIGLISFNGYDDGTPSTQTYATILAETLDVSSGAEKGKLTVNVASYNGTLTETLTLLGSTTGSGTLVNVGIGQSTPLSQLSVGGAMSFPIRYDTTTSQTLGLGDYCLIVNNAGTSVVNLPQLATVGDGRIYRIVSHQAALTLTANGSEDIMGAGTTLPISAANWIDIMSYNTGTTWKLVGKGSIA